LQVQSHQLSIFFLDLLKQGEYLHLQFKFEVVHEVLVVGLLLDCLSQVRSNPVPIAEACVRWPLYAEEELEDLLAGVGAYAIHNSLKQGKRGFLIFAGVKSVRVDHLEDTLSLLVKFLVHSGEVLKHIVFYVVEQANSHILQHISSRGHLRLQHAKDPLQSLWLILVLDCDEFKHAVHIWPQIGHVNIVESLEENLRESSTDLVVLPTEMRYHESYLFGLGSPQQHVAIESFELLLYKEEGPHVLATHDLDLVVRSQSLGRVTTMETEWRCLSLPVDLI
jgi:hypothetical protein